MRRIRECVGKIRTPIAALVFLLTLTMVAGCGGKQGSAPTQVQTKEKKEKVIVFARPEDVQFWDPQDHFNLVSWMMDKLIYNTLVEITAHGKVVPALATGWKVSDDGLTWTFNLRQGTKFHNGETFDAQSVK